jgi:hypothetical protein
MQHDRSKEEVSSNTIQAVLQVWYVSHPVFGSARGIPAGKEEEWSLTRIVMITPETIKPAGGLVSSINLERFGRFEPVGVNRENSLRDLPIRSRRERRSI